MKERTVTQVRILNVITPEIRSTGMLSSDMSSCLLGFVGLEDMIPKVMFPSLLLPS